MYGTPRRSRDDLSILFAPSEPGFDLFRTALVDLFLGENTEVESRKWSIRYRRHGLLRAYFDRARGQLNGEFLIFYPNGKIWMKGGCRNDGLIETTLKFYLPSGEQAKCAEINNIIPFKR